MEQEKENKKGLGDFGWNISNTIALFFFIYLVTLIVQLMWKNFKINKNLENMKNNIEIMALKNEMLEDMLTYYKSDTYKEMQIKQRMMLKKQGEKVILLPIRKDDKPFNDLKISEDNEMFNEKSETTSTNAEKWWDLFFEKK